MSRTEECHRVAALLEGLDRPGVDEPTRAELEVAARHLESCPECGLVATGTDELLDAVSELALPPPGEDFFARNLNGVMKAVYAEPTRGTAVPDVAPIPRVVGRRRRSVSRADRASVRWAGVGFALAAGVALLVTASLIARRPGSSVSPTNAGDLVATRIIAVEGIDPAELVASEDAWLVTRYASFDLAFDEVETGWQMQDLTDEELDSLEGLLGSPPGLG